MKISYGFVFYLEIMIIVLTALSSLLYFRPIRRRVFRFIDKYKIGEGPAYYTLYWIIFGVVFIILVDAILTYWAIKESL
jgi:hypothetical protein